MAIGDEIFVYAQLQDGFEEDDDEMIIEVDDHTGSGVITRVLEGDETSDLESIPDTKQIADVEESFPADFSTGLNNLLADLSYGEAFFEVDASSDDEGFFDYGDGDCDGDPDDSVVLVVVRCDDLGTFTVSFSAEGEDDNTGSILITCVGETATTTITASPTSVEIAPSFANVAHSFVWVNLLDAAGQPAWNTDVNWTTDRCSIDTSEVEDEEGFEGASSLFSALNPLVPKTAHDIEDSNYAENFMSDGSRQQEDAEAFEVVSGLGVVPRCLLSSCTATRSTPLA
jgi:hypothetical protein